MNRGKLPELTYEDGEIVAAIFVGVLLSRRKRRMKVGESEGGSTEPPTVR